MMVLPCLATIVGVWEMPGEFEAYVKLFNEADAAGRALNVAIDDLVDRT